MEPDTADRRAPGGRPRSVGRIALVSLLTGGVLIALVGITARATGGPDAPAEAPTNAPTDARAADPSNRAGSEDPEATAPDDPCSSAPEMCGEGAGEPQGRCADPAMCGEIAPAGDAEEIDAGSAPCRGQLCGEIDPGPEDGARP